MKSFLNNVLRLHDLYINQKSKVYKNAHVREIVLYKFHLSHHRIYRYNHTSVLMPHGTKDLCLHAVVWRIALAHERRMRDWSVNATAGAPDWLPGIVYATMGVKSEE